MYKAWWTWHGSPKTNPDNGQNGIWTRNIRVQIQHPDHWATLRAAVIRFFFRFYSKAVKKTLRLELLFKNQIKALWATSQTNMFYNRIFTLHQLNYLFLLVANNFSPLRAIITTSFIHPTYNSGVKKRWRCWLSGITIKAKRPRSQYYCMFKITLIATW